MKLPRELTGGEHVPQHDCHGLQTCRYHKVNRETLGSGLYTPPSARAASPIALQSHLYICKPSSRQERSPLFLSAAKAILCPGAALVCMHGGAEPEGSCSCTGLTPQHNEQRPHKAAESQHSRCCAVGHLLPGTGGFDLYRDMFSLRCFLQGAGRNVIDAQSSPQTQPSNGRDLTLSPAPGGLCSSASTGLPSPGLKRHKAGKGSGNHNASYGKIFLPIMNLHWGDHCFSYGPSGTSNRANEFSV